MENQTNSKKFEEALHLLNEAAKDKRDEIQRLLVDKYSDIKEVVSEHLAKNKEQVDKLKDLAGDQFEIGKEKVLDAAKDMDKKVRENPWPYIGGIAVTALLIGFIMGGSKNK